MRSLILALAVLSLAAVQDHSNDGPLAATGERCYRGEDDPAHQLHHCGCQLKCYGDTAREEPWDAEHQTGCINYCAPERHPPSCVCHSDETCATPELPK